MTQCDQLHMLSGRWKKNGLFKFLERAQMVPTNNADDDKLSKKRISDQNKLHFLFTAIQNKKTFEN